MHAARRLSLLLTASPLAIALATAASADVAPVPGHFSLQGFGGGAQGGAFSAWLPVIQTPGSVVWANPYSVFGNDFTAAGFGLGYRGLVSRSWAVGAYAFVDGTAVGKEDWLWQGTLGAEAISNGLEARANLYLPLAGNAATGADSPDVVLNGNNMLELVREHRVGATAVDGEVGARLLKWGTGRDGLRAFAGAYSAWRDGVTNSGFSGRVEARFSQPETGLSFTVGGGATFDRNGRTQYTAMAGFSMPLGGTATGGGGDDGVDLAALDADPQHHLGAISITRIQNDPAYFLNGRATGAVQYADGNGNENNGGLTAADATDLEHAVSRTGENGIVVVEGDDGNLLTTGQTLFNGQALVGGGDTLSLAAADGTTGFYWRPEGTSGTILDNSDGYALVLGNYNTINGVHFSNVVDVSNPTDTQTVFVGAIQGIGGTGASLSRNVVNVTVTGTGAAGTDVAIGPTANSVAGNGKDGVSNVVAYGINLDGASDAYVFANDISMNVTGIGGAGGAGTGADGAPGRLGQGGNGGRGIAESSFVALNLRLSENAQALSNTIATNITGTGGQGGVGTGGNATGNAGAAAADGRGGMGGIGVDQVAVYGIKADNSTGIVIDSTVGPDGSDPAMSLVGLGGAGGNASGGAGTTNTAGEPSGGEEADFEGYGAGGDGIKDSSLAAISVYQAQSGPQVLFTQLKIYTKGTGGAGGSGIAGVGAAGTTGSPGGGGAGGPGGDGADGLTLTGIDARETADPGIFSNSVDFSAEFTGGAGGNGTGGDAGAGTGSPGFRGPGFGGNGGIGLASSAFRGITFEDATGHVSTSLNNVHLALSGQGGAGGKGTSGTGSSVSVDSPGAIGGDGGDGIKLTSIVGEDAEGTTSSSIRYDNLVLTVSGTGGNGGEAEGGDGVDQDLRAGDGGAAYGGRGGIGLNTTSFTGRNLASATDALVENGTLTVSLTGLGGAGGKGTGGDGGDSTGTGGGTFGGNGGSSGRNGVTGTLAAGGAGISAGSYVGFNAVDAERGIIRNDTTVINVTATGGPGGLGTSGDGGDGATASDTQNNGGTVYAGNGGFATNATLTGLDARDTENLAYTSSTLVVSLTATGGDAGDAVGGNGGSPGGDGGDVLGGDAGDAQGTAAGAIRGLTIADSTFATVTDNTITVTFNGRGGIGSLVHSGSGGSGGGPGSITTPNAGGSGTASDIATYDDTGASNVTYNSNTAPPPGGSTQEGATVAGVSGS